jgi:DnaJ-class molecular chaperone
MSDNTTKDGAEDGRATTHWDLHCSRCGDEYPADRENALCESCVKSIQMSKLMDGVLCERCDGEGWIYGTWCDLERAMNGRDTRCPECHGTGRVEWEPDPDDVHPDLRAEVKARA